MRTSEYIIGALWVASAIAVAIGTTMMGPTPEDFAIARVCFEVAAALIATSAGVYVFTADSHLWVRISVGTVSAIVAFGGLELGLGLIRDRQQEAIKNQPRPDLQVSIIRELSGKTDRNGIRVPFVVPNLAIQNVGTMPSPVSDYSLKATIAGRDYPGEVIFRLTFYKTVVSEISPGAPTDDPGHLFMFNVTKKPIGIGDKVYGYIAFDFPELGPDSITPGVQLTLSFHDIVGKKYSVPWLQPANAPHFPGQTYVPSMDPMR